MEVFDGDDCQNQYRASLDKLNNDNIATLVPGKSDKEVAAELKAEIVLGAQAYLDICTKAAKLGFIIQMQCGPNAFGETVIQQLVVSKQY